MSEQALEKLTSDYLKLQLPVSGFTWQGGEPTLMGLDFYKKAVQLQQKYTDPGHIVTNALQSNAVLLDEQWCKFLSRNKFLVGISLDGPREYHDYYRVDNAGNVSFDKVMTAIENCRRHKVEFNILILLNNKNVEAVDELFDFFRDNKIKYLQFIPCIERDTATGQIAEFSITAEQYGNFLCRIFDRWIEHSPEKISIRTFDSVLSYCLTGRHSVCTFSPMCNDYVVVEHNGDVFSCDFFVEQQWRLGNIFETPIDKLAAGKRKQQFAQNKSNISNKCLVCRYLSACRGGCLKDRLVCDSSYNEPSYFCQSYKQFYDYALGRFWQLAAELKQNQ